MDVAMVQLFSAVWCFFIIFSSDPKNQTPNNSYSQNAGALAKAIMLPSLFVTDQIAHQHPHKKYHQWDTRSDKICEKEVT